MNNSNTRHDAVAVSSLYLGCADMWLWGGLLGSQFSKLFVRSLEFEPPLSLRGLNRGLERGQHGVRLGEHLLVVGLALVGGLQHLLGLELQVAEVTGAGEAGEEAEEDLLTGLLLSLKAAAKIVIF